MTENEAATLEREVVVDALVTEYVEQCFTFENETQRVRAEGGRWALEQFAEPLGITDLSDLGHAAFATRYDAADHYQVHRRPRAAEESTRGHPVGESASTVTPPAVPQPVAIAGARESAAPGDYAIMRLLTKSYAADGVRVLDSGRAVLGVTVTMDIPGEYDGEKYVLPLGTPDYLDAPADWQERITDVLKGMPTGRLR